jgi:WD40 repeat protein
MKKCITILFVSFVFAVSVSAQIGNVVIPDGHAVGIEKMLLSVDGKYLYSANNQKIIMWDAKQHIQLYSFSLAVDMSMTEALSSFILSNDGNYVAATGAFGIKCFSTVTGKSVFNTDGLHYSATFSPDSKKIYFTGEMQDPITYNRQVGILSVDLISLVSTPVLICAGGNCNYREFGALKNGLVMLKHSTGWQIADLDAKKIIFTSDVDTKTTLFGDVKEKTFIPLANTDFIIASEHKKGEFNAQLNFYNALSGKKIFSKQIGTNWKIIPGTEGNSFLLDAGSFSDELELLDAKNGGSAIKKFNKSALGLLEGENLTSGIVHAKNKNIFFNTDGNVKEIDVQSLKTTTSFKREIAGLPISANYEHNEQNQQLRVITDYSNYISIDLKRMKVENNVLLTNTGKNYTEINFSNTGDTLSVNEDGKGFFYIIKNGKKTAISPTMFGEVTFESEPRPNLFFGKEGKYAYAIKNEYINRGDAQTVYQINIATNIPKKIAAFQHNLEIDIQQDIITGYDKTATSFVLKCWQLSTGKQIFTKIIPRISQEPKLLGARVFDGQTKIALLSQGYLRVFNMADGKQLSATDERLLSSDNKFIINHRASLITEINNNGMLVFKDSTLNRRNLIQAHDGNINKAYYSVNDDLIYTAGSDNTIKIFRTYTGKLIGTLYIFKDSKDFVFIDPTGRFDGTPEGIKKLYYVKDRKVITLDKIYEKFYTPNLYQRLLNGEVFDPINIIIKGTPKVKIAYAEATRNLDVEEDTPTYQNKTGFAEIVVSAVTDDDAIDEIRLFHNGKIVTLTSRNLIVANNDGGSETKKYQLALLPGNNSIRAIALNTQRTESNADEIVVNYSTVANNNTPVVTKPVSNNGAVVSLINKDATLHLIVVGINEYQNKTMSLNYAIADATSFKEELEKDAKTILTNIKTYFVTNSTADKTGIINAFKQVQQNAKPQDVFVFYYAGHGVIGKDKEFYLVPTDVSDLKNVQGELEQKGIASKLLQQYAIDIQAQKQLFILDACQSAGAFEKLLSNDGDQQKSLAVVARSTGTHWMAASGAMQYANEFSSLGHGVFTYVLLQALKGEAANNKMITVNGLKNFLQEQVPLLMKKYNGAAQYPASYGFGNDFPVEVIK